jgi:hypothetical protein
MVSTRSVGSIGILVERREYAKTKKQIVRWVHRFDMRHNGVPRRIRFLRGRRRRPVSDNYRRFLVPTCTTKYRERFLPRNLRVSEPTREKIYVDFALPKKIFGRLFVLLQ